VLAVSDHVLLMVVHALRRQDWPTDAIRAYAIRALAERSAGGYYTDVPRTQHDSPDPEDNLILDLTVHADADLIVTNDSDLLQLGRVHGWKGRPIIDPHRFTALADGAAQWEGRP
jgi:predicted nucleic acid-binding protein